MEELDGLDESDILDLVELQRLTRELLDHLTAMFSAEEAADLPRAMADTVEDRTRQETATRDTSRRDGLN